MERIVVLGGGYAGVMAALRAGNRAPDARVTLVSDRPALVERIRLHEAAARGRPVTHPLRELLPRAELVGARVDGVDRERREVHAGARTLPYDRLVVALGTEPAVDALPGASAHALQLELDGARRLHAQLPELAARGGRVAVVGGGLAGVELAAELAEAVPAIEVHLVTADALGERFGGPAYSHARAVLQRLGVTVHEHARVDAVEAGVLRLGEDRLCFDACVAVPGTRGPATLRTWGFPVDAAGRARVDRALRLVDDPHVLVAGDCAAATGFEGVPLPGGCKTAMPLGALAGDNAVASLVGGRVGPCDWVDVLWCVSLGRRDGVIQWMHSDSTPRRSFVSGRAAAFVKERICRYTMTSLRWERDGRVSYRYLQGRRRPHRLLRGVA